MDVNGLHFNRSGWSYIAGAINHYCGEYLQNQKCIHGYYKPEELGLKSWDEYDGNCLDAMGHNGAEAWPEEVALEVCAILRPKVSDGVLAVDMAEQGYQQDEINYTVERLTEFLDAIGERPDCCIFL